MHPKFSELGEPHQELDQQQQNIQQKEFDVFQCNKESLLNLVRNRVRIVNYCNPSLIGLDHDSSLIRLNRDSSRICSRIDRVCNRGHVDLRRSLISLIPPHCPGSTGIGIRLGGRPPDFLKLKETEPLDVSTKSSDCQNVGTIIPTAIKRTMATYLHICNFV